MDVACAIELVKGITYKPEWRFEVRSHEKRFKATLLLTAYYNVRDTDYRTAPEYGTWIEVFSSWPIVCEGLTEEALYAHVFRIIMLIELHEAREFFSVRGDYSDKPYHPHREAGMWGWAAAVGRDPNRQVSDDLAFGVAFAREM